MPVLKCLKPFPYGEAHNRVKLKPGDLFKCKDKHVPILTRAGLAAKPDMVEAKPVPVYQTRHMEAEKPSGPTGAAGIVGPVGKHISEFTVSELRDLAGRRGIHLPSGYVTKSELVDILQKA